jgi:mono/diheme cytochrome c family protein
LKLWILGTVIASLAGGLVEARESAEKRHYFTKVLRSYLVTIDRGLTQAQRGSLDAGMRQALAEGFESLKPKLSPKRLQDLGDTLKKLETATDAGDVKLMRDYRGLVFEAFRVVTIPTQTPEIHLGIEVYKEHCAACHGATGHGDGKLAQNKRFPMVPPPPHLDRLAEEGQRTAFSYYNLLLMGVEGTPMQAYDVSLTDDQRWSLAFYLMARPFQGGKPELWVPEEVWKSLAAADQVKLQDSFGTLEQLADYDDTELAKQMRKLFPERKDAEIAALMQSLRRSLPYFSRTPRLKR